MLQGRVIRSSERRGRGMGEPPQVGMIEGPCQDLRNEGAVLLEGGGLLASSALEADASVVEAARGDETCADNALTDVVPHGGTLLRRSFHPLTDPVSSCEECAHDDVGMTARRS